jgi:hypothetical protein
MTSEEMTKYFNRDNAELEAKYGFKIIDKVPEQSREAIPQ